MNTVKFTPEEINALLDQLNTHPGSRLQYIGARYVPIFGRKGEASIEWDNTGTYEPLTIVLYQGNSYTSRQYVPVGIDINNTEFWANTGNYNAQIEAYRKDVLNAVSEIANLKTELTSLNRDFGNLQENVNSELTTIDRELSDVKSNVTKNTNSISDINSNISNIVADRKSNYVTYKDFGAVLDGVTDDSTAIKAAHTYANENGCNVVQMGGKLKGNFSVDVKTNCYLDLELLIDQTSPAKVYNIMPDEAQELTYTGTVSANATEAYIQQLYGMSARVVCENGTWKVGTRTDGSIIYNTITQAWDNEGTIISTPINVTNTGTFAFKNVHSIYERIVEFSGLKINMNMGGISGSNVVVNTSRNNSVIKNITCNVVNIPPATANTYGHGIVEVSDCINVTVDNVIAQNNSATATTNWAYVLSCLRTFNLTVSNCVFSGGWGNVGNNFNDNTTFINCVTNRIDNHYGCFGMFSIENCKLTGLAQVRFGYGNATVNIKNCDFQVSEESFVIIASRDEFTDTKTVFSGVLNVDSCTFDDYTTRNNVNNLVIQLHPSGNTAFGNIESTANITNINYSGKRCLVWSNNSAIKMYIIDNFTGNLNIFGRANVKCSNSNLTAITYNSVPASNRVYFNGCYISSNTTTSTCPTKLYSCLLNSFDGGITELAIIGCYINGNSTVTGSTVYSVGSIWAAPVSAPSGIHAKGNIGIADQN